MSLDDLAVLMERAFNSGDASGLAALYHEEAVLMPPNEAVITGRPAIQRWFQEALDRIGEVRIVVADTHARDDLAVQVGTFTVSAVPPHSGKYMLFLVRTNGDWWIQNDIWNLDRP